jgi:hypothetical protein
MKPLTPLGVARILQRGIRAHFSPEKQKSELDKLVEYLEALIMSREDEIRYEDCDLKVARSDVEYLQGIINAFDGDFIPGVNR